MRRDPLCRVKVCPHPNDPWALSDPEALSNVGERVVGLLRLDRQIGAHGSKKDTHVVEAANFDVPYWLFPETAGRSPLAPIGSQQAIEPIRQPWVGVTDLYPRATAWANHNAAFSVDESSKVATFGGRPGASQESE